MRASEDGPISEARNVYLRFKATFGGGTYRSADARKRATRDPASSTPFGGGRDPRGLGEVMDALTSRLGWDSPLAKSELLASWESIVGAETAEHSSPAGIDEGVLAVRCDSTAWATQLRYFVDNINYAWARWVLNYDEQRQWRLLRNLLGEVSPPRMVLLVALVGGVPLACLALSALRLPTRRSEDPASRAYLRCCRALARRGVARRPEETPQAFLARVRQQAPQWSSWLAQVTEAYVASSYRPAEGGRQDILQRRLQRLRRPFKNPL